jgi:CheY-like chemotaxis protein
MINLEYHKGHICIYQPILCQEGWCSGCAIYQDRSIENGSLIEQNNRLGDWTTTRNVSSERDLIPVKEHLLILAVDDDEIFLKIVHDTLTAEGFRVIEATNALAAFSLLAKRKPDLVLLDIMMPNYDGYQTLEMIRLYSNVPVIMLTCLNNQTSLMRTTGNSNADDYITKPFSSKVLVDRIKAKLRPSYDTLRYAVSSPGNQEGNINNSG